MTRLHSLFSCIWRNCLFWRWCRINVWLKAFDLNNSSALQIYIMRFVTSFNRYASFKRRRFSILLKLKPIKMLIWQNVYWAKYKIILRFKTNNVIMYSKQTHKTAIVIIFYATVYTWSLKSSYLENYETILIMNVEINNWLL